MAQSQDRCTKRQCFRITLPKSDRWGTTGASDGWLARKGLRQTTAREPGKQCIASAVKSGHSKNALSQFAGKRYANTEQHIFQALFDRLRCQTSTRSNARLGSFTVP